MSFGEYLYGAVSGVAITWVATWGAARFQRFWDGIPLSPAPAPKEEPYRVAAENPAVAELASALHVLVEPFIPLGVGAAYRERTKQRCVYVAKAILARSNTPPEQP